MGTASFRLPVTSEQIFESISIPVDNRRFEKCTFVNCVIVYRGGPVEVSNCRFEGVTKWEFLDCAATTVLAMKAFGWRIDSPT